MEPIKVALCPDCEHCPSVEVTQDGVRIGEERNVVVLSHAEWNDLVKKIREGELQEV